MFCDHVLDYDAGELIRDPVGRVLCPECAGYCERCGRRWFRRALSGRGLCADCERVERGAEEAEFPENHDTERAAARRPQSLNFVENLAHAMARKCG